MTFYTAVLCVFLLVGNMVLGLFLVIRARDALMTQIKGRMMDVAQIAADTLDGDTLGAVTAPNTDEYRGIARSLSHIQMLFQKNIDLKYIYAIRDMGNGEFSFTVDPDPNDPGQFGEAIAYTEALYAASCGTPDADLIPVEDRWGRYYSAYCPVFDSVGNIAGIVGVDFDAQWIENQLLQFSVIILIASTVSLLICFLMAFLINNRLRRRFNLLYGDLSTLSDDVETLVTDMTGDSAREVAEQQGEFTKEDTAGDDIDAVGQEIHHMHLKIKQYVSFMQKQAYTDSMTGVQSKTAYLEVVRRLDEEIGEGTAAFAIAVFDVNGLKTINDNYGHVNGDRVITDTAMMIRAVFGADHVFRIGGDEFIAVLEQTPAEDVLDAFARLDQTADSFNKKERNYPMYLSFSKGFAVYLPGIDREYREVFKRADEAMYREKSDHYRRQEGQ
ncbi:MAG: diguanylate cyclase [Clostridia bacterium]|nr:diguanylate cyclase [Clostridia bacterium]